eukprot:CAMPEP_0176465538 /NCGR_PEP_ID=MMETSP0127-20121128/37334_1 /TAXON_ID=938130 /ORGANISM="Platyophrya macrostoma, Strain WH" /LENGTH=95 /DNA_ID=CAMNT_0017858489 /DNA_START=1 /DNA_END=285 /DNA_ORIENTATION=+
MIRSAHELMPLSASRRPITNISVIKIDAEGMDALVLYGASEVLHMTHVVVFECHTLWKERGGEWNTTSSRTWFQLQEVAEFLSKHGFDVYKVGVY